MEKFPVPSYQCKQNLLIIPTILQPACKSIGIGEVLKPDYLLSVLTKDDWAKWLAQQRLIGGESALISLMPAVYSTYFAQYPPSVSNILTNAEDTKELDMVVLPYVSGADSLSVVKFNRSILSVPERELFTKLSRELRSVCGYDTYARTNGGFIYKSAMLLM